MPEYRWSIERRREVNNSLETVGAFGCKGYTARPEYSTEDGVFYGRILGISDLVDFQSESEEKIEMEFHDAVDKYLNLCTEIGKEPLRPE